MIKVVALVFCLACLAVSINIVKSDMAVTIAKISGDLYPVLNVNTIEARYVRASMAWNGACNKDLPFSEEMRMRLATKAYEEMQALNDLAPGYRNVSEIFELMKKARP